MLIVAVYASKPHALMSLHTMMGLHTLMGLHTMMGLHTLMSLTQGTSTHGTSHWAFDTRRFTLGISSTLGMP